MARPRKEIDSEQFKKLCSIQCTLTEIASWFKCSEDTIERWCKRTFKMSFAESFKTWSADGKISLRRTQFKMAENSVAMAIWLGKQYLGQVDRQEMTVNGETDETVEKMSDYFNRRIEEDKKTQVK